MKVAKKVILVFNAADGFGSSISAGLRPNPSSGLGTKEDSFELSLEWYGIKDRKASGTLLHFHNADGSYEVSIMLLESYEPPLLSCVLHEVLTSLASDNPSFPTLVVPVIVEASKLKLDNNSSIADREVSLYGLPLGSRSDLMESLLSQMPKPPPRMQVHNECLSCLLQLIRTMGLPTFVLIGQTGRQTSHKTSDEEVEVIYEIGEKLASFSSLIFSREKVIWNPKKPSIETKEPWRALYG